MHIRRVTPADIRALAEVHVASWRTTYTGLLPDEVIAERTIQRRMAQWAESVRDDRQISFVAVDDAGRVVGFASGGPSRSDDVPHQAELYAIYLLEAAQGRGVGRALMQEFAHALHKHGFPDMHLWVLKGNPAEGFYTAMGGERISEKAFRMGGVTVHEVCYGWDDLSTLS